ncbi:hypothetical protein ACJ72_02057 [Emergomyces africanus]|uniref:Uncharacterized protein n=1 Tax=Emergomyces africanus TaxID=1955775 RepID=A0A1B7P3J1_9EURO|nr:hypothetical protein ACJ72_02057 [Emergomyces africanus]
MHTTTTTSPYAIPQSAPRPAHSFSSTTTTNPTATPSRNTFSHTPPPAPQYPSQTAPPTSGLSPTKHSPAHPQPPLSATTTSSPFSSFGTSASTPIAAAAQPPILPPVRRLEPSPKLMGRASPDAPIPAPVKSMTPDQEDRRRREDELAAAAPRQEAKVVVVVVVESWDRVPVQREGQQGQLALKGRVKLWIIPVSGRRVA